MHFRHLPWPLLCLALFGTALVATGCSPAQQVVGTWDLDHTKALPSDFFEANPLIAALMVTAKPQFQVRFEGDGNFQLKYGIGSQVNEHDGSWRYVKSEGSTLIIMVKERGKTEESELRFTLVDNEHAEIQIPLTFSKKPFSFVKAKPAS